ncbi:hypothetical protein OG864_00365 [Streptomyces sp. NBC_00124]|uniref:hypothetical protein n=1 Tax=Streptomyces sp. NBC_00124 TaxID=2975662 RepID=UPI00225269AD|nr:hypothetical protein [Streptomyces sp. NBC_00124]MCX5357241.1 hypothetical protein [Streptomyces sp. NBC_00124]
MRSIRSLLTGLLAAGAAGAAVLSVAVGATLSADTTPTPGSARSADAAGADRGTGSSGLALRTGATLAPPKILDIGSDPVDITQLISDQDGADRHQAQEKEKQ